MSASKPSSFTFLICHEEGSHRMVVDFALESKNLTYSPPLQYSHATSNLSLSWISPGKIEQYRHVDTDAKNAIPITQSHSTLVESPTTSVLGLGASRRLVHCSSGCLIEIAPQIDKLSFPAISKLWVMYECGCDEPKFKPASWSICDLHLMPSELPKEISSAGSVYIS